MARRLGQAGVASSGMDTTLMIHGLFAVSGDTMWSEQVGCTGLESGLTVTPLAIVSSLDLVSSVVDFLPPLVKVPRACSVTENRMSRSTDAAVLRTRRVFLILASVSISVSISSTSCSLQDFSSDLLVAGDSKLRDAADD